MDHNIDYDCSVEFMTKDLLPIQTFLELEKCQEVTVTSFYGDGGELVSSSEMQEVVEYCQRKKCHYS